MSVTCCCCEFLQPHSVTAVLSATGQPGWLCHWAAVRPPGDQGVTCHVLGAPLCRRAAVVADLFECANAKAIK